jgi:hypothetical protein
MQARSRSSVSECFSAFAPHLFVLTHDSAISAGARSLPASASLFAPQRSDQNYPMDKLDTALA